MYVQSVNTNIYLPSADSPLTINRGIHSSPSSEGVPIQLHDLMAARAICYPANVNSERIPAKTYLKAP